MLTARRVCLLATLLLGPCTAVAEVAPVWSAEWGSPQRLSASVGLRLGPSSPEGGGTGAGLLLQVQPGLDAGSVNLGWVPFSVDSAGGPAVGVAVKARALRTWRSRGDLESGRTFVGAELSLSWVVKLSVGVARRIGDGAGQRTVLTWSVGIGL